MICILGDLHLSSAKPYLVKVGEAFLEWFDGWEHNKKGNELILAGDLLQSAVNGGVVLYQLQMLAELSRFDKIHIIPGNHDLKWREGVPQLGFDFFRHNPKIVIYDRITEVTIQDHRFLLMPHYIPEKGESDMVTAYSIAYATFKGPYDCVVGHFMEEAASIIGAIGGIHNIRKINSKYICLGHVHTKIDPVYIESVYACKISEASGTRSAWIFENHEKREELLPVFLDYVTIKYGDPLPPQKAIVTVYTFTGCRSESLVYSKYGSDIFIRKVVQDLSVGSIQVDGDVTMIDSSQFDLKTCFRNFLKTKGIDRSVAQLCLSKL
jgi:hypothetical protein